MHPSIETPTAASYALTMPIIKGRVSAVAVLASIRAILPYSAMFAVLAAISTGDLPRGKSPVEMAASTANIAEYGNMARMLAKTATAETLPLIIGMVKAYEAAVGVSIEGCTSEALKKIAGVDAAVK